MNIIDVLIILLILFGAFIGFKRGFTKELLCFVGFIIIVILAFVLKNPVSSFLYENLPFFNFGGFIKGVSALNILVYEIIAFLVVFSLLMIIFGILKLITSVFEKILTLTIILGIPSKILGAVIGVVHYFIIVFIGLYVLALPVFDNDLLDKSKLAKPILTKTPILSLVLDDTMKVIDEFKLLKDKYENDTNASEFNKETVDLFLKYKIVTIESIDKLVKNGKLQLPDTTFLNKYREG